jgi:hypothetical protein
MDQGNLQRILGSGITYEQMKLFSHELTQKDLYQAYFRAQDLHGNPRPLSPALVSFTSGNMQHHY